MISENKAVTDEGDAAVIDEEAGAAVAPEGGVVWIRREQRQAQWQGLRK